MSENHSNVGKSKIMKIINAASAHVHFLGVGGVGMSALFRLSEYFGISASGSDASHGEYVDALLNTGARVSITSGECLPENTTLLVYSLAVSENDPTLRKARERGIVAVSRAEYLGAIMSCYEKCIGIAGSHGKSTVTAMLSHIFSFGKKQPTTLSGASLGIGGSQLQIGALDYFICEACEYKDSFLHFPLDTCVFLNLEYDHVDYFHSFDSLKASFLSAMKGAGKSIVCSDDRALSELCDELNRPLVTFGKKMGADYRYEITSGKPRAMSFVLYYKNKPLGEVTLSLLGEFNVSNATAAIACAMEHGIPFDDCRRALVDFRGIDRRLEVLGSLDGRRVYYDYAHHPTEIREGIKAVKSDTGGKITLIFGAHTYSRTKALWNDFVRELREADFVFLTEIAGIRESVIEGITAEALASAIGAEVIESYSELVGKLRETEGAIIIMGARDMTEVKNLLINS
ncbi:MAG: hypothetical protein IJ515_05210 [Clostridia bacterium]|nr:hypothetical protein [Clostridia bacterium]